MLYSALSANARFETYPHGNLWRWLRRLSVDVVPLRHAHVRTSRTSAQTKKAQMFYGLDPLHRLRTVTVVEPSFILSLGFRRWALLRPPVWDVWSGRWEKKELWKFRVPAAA